MVNISLYKMGVTANMKWNDQSTFFSHLHHYVRREIYIQLFGGTLVHIRHKPVRGTGYYLTNFACGRSDCAHLGISEGCKSHGRLSTNILFTCKRAYQEGLAILYTTNKISFDCSRHFAYFGIYSQANLARVRNLDFAIRAFLQTNSGCTDMCQILDALCNRVPFAVNVRISLNMIDDKEALRFATESQVQTHAVEVMTLLSKVMDITKVNVEFSIPELFAPYFQAHMKESWTRFKLKVVPEKCPQRSARSRNRAARNRAAQNLVAPSTILSNLIPWQLPEYVTALPLD